MNFLLLPIVLVLVVSFISVAENSHIQFRANPSAIHPILTTTFQLRCSLQGYPWIKEATNAGVSANPFLRYFDYPTISTTKPTTQSYYMMHSTGLTTHTTSTTPYFFTAPKTTTPPALNIMSADVAHVTSIVIIKLTEYGQREDVASVSLFEAATSDGHLASQANVEGSCERSPVVGEQAYLSVTWSRPLQDQSGEYICEISGLVGDRHPVMLQYNLQISFSQPTLNDLVNYILENAMKISALEKENSNLKNEIMNLNSNSSNFTSLTNKAQQIQTGSGECLYSTTQPVLFTYPYKSSPTVFLSITNFTLRHYSNYDQPDGSVSVYSVSPLSFYVQCHLTDAVLAYDWMAIDN